MTTVWTVSEGLGDDTVNDLRFRACDTHVPGFLPRLLRTVSLSQKTKKSKFLLPGFFLLLFFEFLF